MTNVTVPPADVAALRREYAKTGIRKGAMDVDPLAQFRHWFGEVVAAGLIEPNAMVLSTTDGHRPSSRSVLLKAYDERGFVFFTNYESRKARDIAANASVSLLFPWYALERQVGILGRAEKVTSAEALAYFASRPRGSRLGAWVSSQSTVINSRRLLEMKWQEVKQKFADGEVPLPSFWGGFRVVPSEIEFWQGRENRLHDRLRYSRDPGGWRLERLAP